MTAERAFELDDLTVLLGPDPGGSADHADIEAIGAVLDRRRTGGRSGPPGPDRPGPALHLVPDHRS